MQGLRIFDFAGITAFLAGFAAFGAIKAARRRETRTSALLGVLAVALAGLGVGAFWFGTQTPPPGLGRSAAGFPPDWRCINLWRGWASEFCWRESR